MKSLVVLVLVLALATASPSGFLLNGYGAPGLSAGILHVPNAALLRYFIPAAVSYQLRLDIKNTPATAAPVVKIIAAPSVIPSAAGSHQFHTGIKSTPAIAFISAATVPIAYTGSVTTAAVTLAVVNTAVAVTPLAHNPHLTATAATSDILKKTANATPPLATTAALAAPVSYPIATLSVPNDDPEQIDPRSIHFEAKAAT